jgi:hypothetical protein
MKRIFILAGLIFIAMATKAQHAPPKEDSWKIKLNNKLLLATSKEDEKANSKKITSAEWRMNGYLEISYTESDPAMWKRSFLFYDEQDNQLISKEGVTYFKTSIANLHKAFAGKKEIRIYTTVSPRDPNIAIRIRRVHLCTLQLP